MPSEQDRDDLARIIGGVTEAEWGRIAEWRKDVSRTIADAVLAAGWQPVERLIQPIHESVMYALRPVVMFTSDEETEAMSTAVLEAIVNVLTPEETS
jgi:hypothetical protein